MVIADQIILHHRPTQRWFTLSAWHGSPSSLLHPNRQLLMGPDTRKTPVQFVRVASRLCIHNFFFYIKSTAQGKTQQGKTKQKNPGFIFPCCFSLISITQYLYFFSLIPTRYMRTTLQTPPLHCFFFPLPLPYCRLSTPIQ